MAEQFTKDAVLGIRFWDTGLDLPIEDGLVAVLWPEANPRLIRRAVAGPTGLYSFHDIPVLSSGWKADPADASKSYAQYVVEVGDTHGRFLRASLRVRLCRQGERMFLDPAEPRSADQVTLAVPLFSAPTRLAPTGVAAIRGVLARKDAPGKPAAHALLEATVEGSTYYGLSDAKGSVALLFPCPRMREPGAGTGGPASVEWTVQLRVLYQGLEPAVPDVRELLRQPVGKAWLESGATDSWSVTLAYGKPAVLASKTPDGAHGPLLIERGT